MDDPRKRRLRDVTGSTAGAGPRVRTEGSRLPPITRRLLVEPRDCAAWEWRTRRQRNGRAPDSGSRFLRQQGREVGRLARALFPDGVLVANGSAAAAAARTARLLAAPSVTALFEGTFVAEECVARPDILVRDSRGFKLIEVRPSFPESDCVDDHIDDATFTAMVVERSGLPLWTVSLLLLSRDYRRGMHVGRLFLEMDVTNDVRARMPGFARRLAGVIRRTGAASPPAPRLCAACVGCEHFMDDCVGRGERHPVTELAGIAGRIAAPPEAIGIRDSPDGIDPAPAQRRVVPCVPAGRGQVDPRLATPAAAVQWPARYLDFETLQTAIPLHDGVAPHEPVVFQYSIDLCTAPGRVEQHREFLSNPARDDRRALVKRLIRDLGERGTIVTYSRLEETRIRSLQAKFPDVARPLEGILARLRDLLALLRTGYYHPGFHGGYSIKQVLPALVPGFNYDDLEIRDGTQARACFAEAAAGRLSAGEWKRLRAQLLAHCGRDTLAMVKMHELVLARAGQSGRG